MSFPPSSRSTALSTFATFSPKEEPMAHPQEEDTFQHAARLELPSKTDPVPHPGDNPIISGSTSSPGVQTPVAKVRDSPHVIRRTKPIKTKRTTYPIFDPVSVLTKPMSHIPVRNMRTWVTRDTATRHREVAEKNGRVSRPMNSFMLYRSAYTERIKAWFAETNNQVVSKVSGQSWPMEPAHVRDQYEALALIERVNHRIAHPNYKFSPKKTRNPHTDERREGEEFNRSNTPCPSPISSKRIKTSGSNSSFTSHGSTPSDNHDHLSDIHDLSSWQSPESRYTVAPHVSPSTEAGYLIGHNELSPSGGQGHPPTTTGLINAHYNTTSLAGIPDGVHHERERSYPSGPAIGHLDGPQPYPQFLNSGVSGADLYSFNQPGLWQMNQNIAPNFNLATATTGFETIGMYTISPEEDDTL